jgi:Rad3-related DNA helicase
LGHAIRRIIEAVSDKVLILFPAMTYYESCSAVWKADESLREFGEMLQVVFSCGPGTCAICAGNMEFRRREGHSAMTFVRGATLDGVSGGYQAVVAVSLPYQFLLDPKIAAKKAFLSALDRTAAFDFYTQDAVHAMALPFIKATALDPLSPLRGRIFIVLDSRLQKHLRFLPPSLQQVRRD